MKTQLIICRHGNTGIAGEPMRRQGAGTDAPLTEEKLGTNIGLWLKQENITPDVVIAGPLKRQKQTAELAIKAAGLNVELVVDERFQEVDYGTCENLTEEEVREVLGKGDYDKGDAIINEWNANGTVPPGWAFDAEQTIADWKTLAEWVEENYAGKTVAVFSSNGIIRFTPHLTGDFEAFAAEHEIKVKTGSIAVFEKEASQTNWDCPVWNFRHKPE